MSQGIDALGILYASYIVPSRGPNLDEGKGCRLHSEMSGWICSSPGGMLSWIEASWQAWTLVLSEMLGRMETKSHWIWSSLGRMLS